MVSSPMSLSCWRQCVGRTSFAIRAWACHCFARQLTASEYSSLHTWGNRAVDRWNACNRHYLNKYVLLVKKDGSWCYLTLNKATVADKYLIPINDEFLMMSTKLDLNFDYYQIHLTESAILKTTFRTWAATSFLWCLSGSPTPRPIFQSHMNDIFCPFYLQVHSCFFYNILIYCHSGATHYKDLATTLQAIHEYQI